jgi:hypothetical protein
MPTHDRKGVVHGTNQYACPWAAIAGSCLHSIKRKRPTKTVRSGRNSFSLLYSAPGAQFRYTSSRGIKQQEQHRILAVWLEVNHAQYVPL